MNAIELNKRIVDILLDGKFVWAEGDRKTLITASWGPSYPLAHKIDLSGKPEDFAYRFVQETRKYGRRDETHPAIISVLEHLHEEVGAEQQQEIQTILNWLREDPRLLDEVAPYKGLLPYEEKDASNFFGRDDLINSLSNRIQAWENDQQPTRLLAIIGASGSGKSSLVKAGLIPKLRQETEWRILDVIRPGTGDPLPSLAGLLNNSAKSDSNLVDELMASEESLASLVKDEDRGILLVVDQFEELFVRERSKDNGIVTQAEARRTAFIGNLLHAVTVPQGPLRLIITFRADFYQYLNSYDKLRDTVAQQQEYIGAVTDAELREIIEVPARLASYELEEGLSNTIIRELKTGDGKLEASSLPLLSHVLLETWQKRQKFTLMLADYDSIGGVEGALRNTAEQVYGDLSSEEKIIARELFVALTELGESTEDTRRRRSWSQLEQDFAHDPVLLKGVIEKFVGARLIVADRLESELPILDQTENDLQAAIGVPFSTSTYIEVTHEALIREWRRLREWLDGSRTEEIVRRKLVKDAEEWWDARKQDSSPDEMGQRWKRDITRRWAGRKQDDFLYRGERLREAEKIVQTDKVSEQIHEFLEASRAYSRSNRSRLYALIVAAFMALLLLSVFAYLTVILPIFGRYPARAANLVEIESLGVAFEAYEVTNRRYRWCVDARECDSPDSYSQILDNWQAEKDKPVVGIDAADAMTFCHWIGRTLPTAEQWVNIAPRPVSEWGDLEADKALLSRPPAPLELTAVGDLAGRKGQYIPDPNNPEYAVYDLVGSVEEWTRTIIVREENNDACRDVNEFSSSRTTVIKLGDDFENTANFVNEEGNRVEGDTGKYITVADSQTFSGNQTSTLGFRCVTFDTPDLSVQTYTCPSFPSGEE